MPERLFTTYQVADLLGATPGAVVEWIQKGWLPVQRLPDGPLRISEKGLIRFLKQRGVDIEKIMAKVILRESQQPSVTQAEREALVAPRPEGTARRRDSQTPQPADRAAAEEWVLAELNREESPESPAEAKADAARSGRGAGSMPEPVAAAVAPESTEPEAAETAPSAPTAGEERLVLPEPAEVPPAAEALHEGVVPGPAAEPFVEAPLAGPAAEPQTVERPVVEPPGKAQEQAPDTPAPVEVPEHVPAPLEAPQPVEAAIAAAQVVEKVLRDALARRASHVHLESAGEAVSLRLRIDGVLHDESDFKGQLTQQLAAGILPHLISLAGLEEAQHRPRSGSFSMTIVDRRADFHLSSCPTARGLRVVIAMPSPAEAPTGLACLGLDKPEASDLRRLLRQPCGVVLLAARPAPLRAEAMRAMITSVDFRGRSVVTIGRTGQIDLAGVTAVQVKPQNGLAFSQALGTLVQQDADVIACETLPDPATATAAFEAAEAGKLVLAGMNSPGASAAIGTLLGMGLEPWPLASNLLAVIAFARVRTLCAECREPIEPDEESLESLGLAQGERLSQAYRAAGCPRCSHLGYAGTMGLLSIMMVDEAIAPVIRAGAAAEELDAAARRAGVKDLRRIGLDKVRAGLTSLEELARVIPT